MESTLEAQAARVARNTINQQAEFSTCNRHRKTCIGFKPRWPIEALQTLAFFYRSRHAQLFPSAVWRDRRNHRWANLQNSEPIWPAGRSRGR